MGEMATLANLLTKALYIPRDEAEGNPEWRQIIPYVVVFNPVGGDVFAFTRLAKQSEQRLHQKRSIGVGGHVNPVDGSSDIQTIISAACRELTEELVIDGLAGSNLRFIGFINDLSTPVSRDHLGCVYVASVSSSVAVRETDKMTGSFVSLDEIGFEAHLYESWSRLLLPLVSEFIRL